MSPSESSPTPNPPASVWLAVVAIAIGYVLNPINSSLVVTAYPHLAKVFDVPYAHLSAMVMYFMAATAVAQTLAGGLGDFLGRKRIFIIGISGFTLASASAGLVTSYDLLLLWRVLQAVFSGLIMSNGVALLAQVVPKEKFGFYLGLLTSAVVTGTATGFPLGGFLVSTFDWHILFWINVPFGLLALLLSLWVLPADRPTGAHFTTLSFIGAAVAPLAFGLQALVQNKFNTALLFGVGFIGVVAALVAGVRSSAKSRQQFAVIHQRGFYLGAVLAYMAAAIQFGFFFMLPAWADATMGLQGGLLGLYMSIQSISMLIGSPLAGRYLDRKGLGALKVVGVVSISAGMLLIVFHINHLTLGITMMLMGIGLAIIQLLGQWSALMSVPESAKALANGTYNSMRSAGCLSGNALSALVLGSFSTVTAASGVAVLQWELLLFALPLVMAMVFLPGRK